MDEKPRTGLSQLPPLFTRPLWRDVFFWLILAMLAFWAVVIGYFFV